MWNHSDRPNKVIDVISAVLQAQCGGWIFRMPVRSYGRLKQKMERLLGCLLIPGAPLLGARASPITLPWAWECFSFQLWAPPSLCGLCSGWQQAWMSVACRLSPLRWQSPFSQRLCCPLGTSFSLWLGSPTFSLHFTAKQLQYLLVCCPSFLWKRKKESSHCTPVPAKSHLSTCYITTTVI